MACLAGCGGGRSAKAPEKPRAVRVVTAASRPLVTTVTAVGTLAAAERADLSFKVPGRLRSLRVDIGSRVAQGEVLADLEPRDYIVRLERARASLHQARARLGLPKDGESDEVETASTGIVRQEKAKWDEARAQLARSRSLLAEGLLSRASFDVVEANYKVAESQYHDALEEVENRRGILAERRVDVELAANQLKDTELRSPFAGAVQQRRAGLGEFVASGSPVLVLVRTNPLRLRLDVPEREATGVRAGQRVAVRLDGEASSKDGGNVWQGLVARVSPALEEASRALVVEAEIPNPKGALRPGSFVRAEIETSAGRPALVVPKGSLVEFAGIEKVVLAKDGKALERPVVTGLRAGDFVEITSGVKAGDLVVLEPGNLATGMPIEPEPVHAATIPGASPTAAVPSVVGSGAP